MSWQFLILAHNILGALFVVLQRKTAVSFKGKFDFQIVALVHSIIAVIGIAWAVIVPEKINIDITLEYWPWFLFAGVLFFVSSMTHYAMFKYLDAAIGTIINLMSSFSIVLFSSVFLGETLHGYDFLGAGLLVLAVLVIFTSRQKKKIKSDWLKGGLLALVGAVTIGGAIAVEKYLVDKVGPVNYVPIGFSVQWLLLFLVALPSMKSFTTSLSGPQVQLLLTTGVFRGTAGLAFLLSLSRSGNASTVGSLTTLKVVLVSVLGATLLKERKLLLRKTVAAVIALIGIFILFA